MRSHRLSSDSMRRSSAARQRSWSSEFPELDLSSRAEKKEPEEVVIPPICPGHYLWGATLHKTRGSQPWANSQCLGCLVVKAHLLGLSQADCSVAKARMGTINEEPFGERDSLESFEK